MFYYSLIVLVEMTDKRLTNHNKMGIKYS